MAPQLIWLDPSMADLFRPPKVDKPAEPVPFYRYIDTSKIPELSFSNFTGSYSYLGPIHANLANDATDFCLRSAGVVGPVLSLFTAFLDHVRSEHLTSMHTDLWLSVRVSAPCNTFDLVHWHQDDAYFPTPAEAPAFKIATVFAGPSTMFLQGSDPSKPRWEDFSDSDAGQLLQEESWKARNGAFNMHRVVYRDYEAEQPWFHERPELEEADYVKRRIAVENTHWKWARENVEDWLKDIAIRVPARGEAAKWVIGDGIRGGVHSEPAFTTHRLFVSVVPGTERQIRRLCGLWGEEYGKSYQPDFGGDLQAEYAQVSMTHPLGVDANYL